MKLSTKISLMIVIFFSVVFLVSGYTLISYYYETAMEREIEAATEQYQYNKFVVQSALITQNEHDFNKITSNMNQNAALYSIDGSLLFSQFPAELNIGQLLKQTEAGKVNYQFEKINHRTYVLIAGTVSQGTTSLYLVTGIDVEHILAQQKELIEKFGMIYGAAVMGSLLLIVFLSFLLNRPMKELAAQKEDFAANLAHELKTPLTSIIGYANRIYQKELPREEQKQAAWYIWNEGMRLEALSVKLMDLTVLKHKKFTLQEMRSDRLLEEIVKSQEFHLSENHVCLICVAEPAYIQVEYDLFQSLVFNLIDNSIKAGADRLRLFGLADGEKYIIRLEDNGSGIPQDEIRRIKEAFYMVDKSRSRKQHGAGLGLSLAEKIANIHGSSLQFESDGRSGTRVSITLKCKGVSDE